MSVNALREAGMTYCGGEIDGLRQGSSHRSNQSLVTIPSCPKDGVCLLVLDIFSIYINIPIPIYTEHRLALQSVLHSMVSNRTSDRSPMNDVFSGTNRLNRNVWMD